MVLTLMQQEAIDRQRRAKQRQRYTRLQQEARSLGYTGTIPRWMSVRQFKESVRGGTIKQEITAGRTRTLANLQRLSDISPPTEERRRIRRQQLGGLNMPTSGSYGVTQWSPNPAQQVTQLGLAGGAATVQQAGLNVPAILGGAAGMAGLAMSTYLAYQQLQQGGVVDLPGGSELNIPGIINREPAVVPDLPGKDIVSIKRYGGAAQIVALDNTGGRWRLRSNNTWKRIPKSPYFRVGKAPSKKNVSRLIRALKHHVGISKKYAKLAKMKGVPSK